MNGSNWNNIKVQFWLKKLVFIIKWNWLTNVHFLVVSRLVLMLPNSNFRKTSLIQEPGGKNGSGEHSLNNLWNMNQVLTAWDEMMVHGMHSPFSAWNKFSLKAWEVRWVWSWSLLRHKYLSVAKKNASMWKWQTWQRIPASIEFLHSCNCDLCLSTYNRMDQVQPPTRTSITEDFHINTNHICTILFFNLILSLPLYLI